MLYMLNSLVNPFVYAVRFRSFTVAFKLLFKLIKDEDKATAIESTKWVNPLSLKPMGERFGQH